MPNAHSTDAVTPGAYALPLIVAVTGHRNLSAQEIPEIRARVRELLIWLGEQYPERLLSVMSSLAEGADQLVAEEALALGIRLIVPLPMPRDLYLQDFATADSRQQFDASCSQADEVFELPLTRGASLEQISVPGAARDLQYAQLGVFLCAHCHVLLALWDGKADARLGGTSQVVRFHHEDSMPGYTRPTIATQQMLVDDESDLIYYIVCSRDRENGQPQDGMHPLECCWFTKDKDNPRSRELPQQHQTIFRRSGEFSSDAIRHADRIEKEKCPLLNESDLGFLPPGIENINRIFCATDWLAIYYQKRVLYSMRATHLFAFLMGLMFVLYSDLKTYQAFMIGFVVFFGLAAGVQYLASRGSWHRKYLDYRALAEGLRVQYYWAAAGVSSGNDSKFAHDNFLQTQDPELGWIRNVMRVAGIRCDASPDQDPAGISYVLREWIGDRDSGQLGYFRAKAKDRIRRNSLTERLALVSLVVSVSVIALLVTIGSALSEDMRDPLMAAMGALLLLVAIRRDYAHGTAEKELIKQYEFMMRIFLNARRRLDRAESDAEVRQILRALGGSALDEHAEWILMHRDRALDQGEIWRMGS
ncbi:MAG: hypothetical protein BMS9Abin32_492 [Gammaproteobacteria bacterium]|nr:MAG: hypothetical protein BMS9Abin32_492 [Gammaproteobacteria bacterium]